MFMGLWMYVWRKGRITEATIIGVIGLLLAVVLGEPLNHPDSVLGSYFHYSHAQLTILLGIYGFIASVLPVWLLLSPRGYLSSFTKIGTILLLAFGVLVVNPDIKMPALTEFAGGGGPIIPGPLFPFCFITIACGAISGFHALISSGTTPEDDRQGIGHPARSATAPCSSKASSASWRSSPPPRWNRPTTSRSTFRPRPTPS